MSKSVSFIFLLHIIVYVHGEFTFEDYQQHLQHLAEIADQQSNNRHIFRQYLEDLDISFNKVIAAVGDSVQDLQPRRKSYELVKSSLTFVNEGRQENSSLYSDEFLHCLQDVGAYVDNINNKTFWALQMIDSTGRPGPGILSYRMMFVGDYDECNSIAATYNTSNKNAVRHFDGRYCNGNFHLSFENATSFGSQSWGICLPNSCSNDDALTLSTMAFHYLNVTFLSFTRFDCYELIKLSTTAIVFISLFAFFVIVVFISSVLDVWFIQRTKWRIEAINSLSEEEEREINNDLGNHIGEGDCDAIKFLSDLRTNSNESGPCTKFSLLQAVSAWTNNQKLLKTRQPAETLKCVNGIRVISISWVILGHTALIMSLVTENIAVWAESHFRRWTFQAIQNAGFSVDTFFTMSGLLVAYLSLNEMKRQNGKLNWILFYLHRYLRLTPTYMICLVVMTILVPYLSNGPLYFDPAFRPTQCQSNWWANALYIQNLIKFDQPCFTWGWYLALDMQFYLVSPIIFFPLYHKPVLGYILSAIFFLAVIITPYVLSLTRDYGFGVGSVEEHTPLGDRAYNLYMSPYSRMGPYIIGLLLGYILHRHNGNKIRLNWLINILGWTLASALALAVLYGLFDYVNGKAASLQLSAFYNALSRPAWGLCVAWVIFSCSTGNAGPVNAILSWKAWIPLSRLTYSAYLTHPMVILLWAAMRRTPFFLTDSSLLMVFLASLLATFTVSYIVYLAFEAPLMGVERVLFKREKRSY